MKTIKTILPEFEVMAIVSYVERESRPDQNLHFFSYKMLITNKGHSAAQLMSRNWIITDASGNTEEVRGPGVVGAQPKISPGETFEYESACPLATSHGSMKGSYQFVSSSGETFEVDIPEFYLIAPTALH